MPTDTTTTALVINKLTKAQYDEIQNPSETELYLVPDEIDNVPTSGSDNPVKSGGVYTALGGKQDTIDSSHKLSADLVDDSSSTNKFTNTTEKTTWSGKQAKITATGILKGDGNGGISAALKQDIVDLGIPDTDTNTTYKLKIGSTTNGDSVNGVDLGTIESKSAASGGTDLSLVTTGEKYTWGNKASLDENGKVPSSQLPSYVDDVLEYATLSAFPATGESGKIYVDLSTDRTYRWSGTQYTSIKGDLAIGSTTGTAADGGVVNTHINDNAIHVTSTEKQTWNNKVDNTTTVNGHALSGNVTVTASDVGLSNVDNTADANKEVKAAKAICPIAYLDNNGVGMTVGQVKTWIYTQFNTNKVSVGDYVFVSRNVIENWDDDSHVVTASSTYSFIKIAGGYTDGNINQWMIAGYGNNTIGYVGRMYDEDTSAYAWTPIKWFANLSDVEGFVPKRANNMFYPFVGASPTHGNIFKVTMPSFPDTGNFWYMVTFELVLCGSYNNAPDGIIYTTYYFRRANGTISADVMRAIGVGSNIYNNSVSIKYDIQSPNVFYVDLGTEGYQTLAIENLSAFDSATNFDFSYTTIETVSSIPSAASSTVSIDTLDITIGGDLKFNGQPVVLNNDSRLSDSRKSSNMLTDYIEVSSWSSGSAATTLTEDGSESVIYKNTHNSNTITIPISTSGNVVLMDGNTEMAIPSGKYAEINYLRVTKNDTTRIFVRSTVTD